MSELINRGLFDWSKYFQRYQAGELRSSIFCDMIIDEIRSMDLLGRATVLDIGCGIEFDGAPGLREKIAGSAGKYIGVEPDPMVEPSSVLSEFHRSVLEDAQIDPSSIDVAFSVMVLEHVESPEIFWRKLHDVLKPGGVFWGFTVNSRHWFAFVSRLMKALKIKDLYLDRLHGKAAEDRYINYPVHYRCNSTRKVAQLSRDFSSLEAKTFHRLGQCNYYFPLKLRWIGSMADRVTMGLGMEGSVLVFRLQK